MYSFNFNYKILFLKIMDNIYNQHLIRQGFELKEKIGSGLSGTTRKALQKSLNRLVAVKFFDNSLNRNNNNLKERFVREAIILAELQHPSIPYVITHGSVSHNGEDTPYIVMQYISGKTLEQYIKENAPVSVDIAIHISSQILDVLTFVHGKKIIHRDIKPSNIMISSYNHCYLIDFSIGVKSTLDNDMTRITNTGEHLGSMQYMSPEQIHDMKNVDHRTDIYSYAVVLRELLTGKTNSTGLDKAGIKYPDAVKKIIDKASQDDANERFSSAEEFLRELKRVTSSPILSLDTPGMAVCDNIKCPSADWSSEGYYIGPYFIGNSTNLFCTSCGNKLKYLCENCGSNIIDTPFCGKCGEQLYCVPVCERCGSLLTRRDMDDDTEEYGCMNCRAIYKPPRQITDDDDDIPF